MALDRLGVTLTAYNLDQLTVLVTEIGRPAAKRIFKNDGGTSSVAPIQPSYSHDVEHIEVGDLGSLGEAIAGLECRQNRYVIRGRLIDGRPTESVRRLIRPKNSDLANFEPADRHWCMIDIDELPIPAEFVDFCMYPEQLARSAAMSLPKEFLGVDFWYQFSASMGVKKDLVRVHLWYWLDRAVSDEDLKGWLQDAPVDLALFNPVQPHYTAAPMLAEGIKDPMPERSGFCRVGEGRTSVPVPDVLPAYRRNSRTGSSGGARGGDPSVMYRDPATGLIADGRRSWMLLASNDAMREAVQRKTADALD